MRTASRTAGPRRVIVGMSGASGAPYTRRLLQRLVELDVEVHAVASRPGRRVWADEMRMPFPPPEVEGRIVLHDARDIGASIASGSFQVQGMVICPCSARTLGDLASGTGGNLIGRAGDVCLKERRPLVLVLREAPLNLIHIENMARVTRAGAIVLPASPGFYHRPESIDDLLDFLVAKILDLLGLEHDVGRRWGESPASVPLEGCA